MFQLGIDVSKKTLDLCLLREGVKGRVKTRKLQNDINAVSAVIAWLSKQHCKPEDVHIIMEATGVYHESLAYGLHKAGGRISLANPHRAREFARGMGMLTKNDRVDAYMLACYGVLKAPEPWLPPPEEVRHLSALLRRRDALVADSTREKNRLEKYLATDTPSVIAESVEAMIGQLNAEIKRLDRLIRSHLNQHPELKKDFDLLTSIKSVGYQLGLNMLVILRSHDFATAEQAAAFLGVVPVEKYSDTLVRGCPKLSKIGPPEIRAKLYLASLCGLRFNPLMKAMYERLCLRGKAKMCAIGALMRKLVHWCYGVLKTQKPFDVGYLPSYARSACKAA
ncbi:IS110 family transposase [Escherichia coli]|uniref:IS110 family transposase n=1 Tax=Escherichia coli TaxID=562 RepID=A0A8S7JZT2_ECOLX|nr:IS110 family transposase [Escherichia coli]EFN7271758.1 IS110 family transposase [Escherichia coli O21]EFC9752331.1 IS110 family transposase [Escherichia coli]EHJ8079274.1 IS110 family transposase [Escherichia coli]EIL3151271.1 IS110 family transposase [Escherichia coli]EIS8762397.1 IS110 family transposase [Escherichia coli]